MDKPYEQTKLQQAKERWEAERLDPALAKVSRQRMPSDVKQQRLYTPLDGDGRDYENDLGFPGQYPYTRGVQPSMYQGRLWTMRQYAGFGTPEETHERFEYLLNQGQGGLLVAYDLPSWVSTAMTNVPRARSAWLAWRLTVWRIWKPFSAVCPWRKPRLR